jgi:hypothetical protein
MVTCAENDFAQEGLGMRKLSVFVIAATATVAFATGGKAADVPPIVPITMAAAEEPAKVAAMVEIFGGGAHMTLGVVDDPECQGCHNLGLGFGGEGRAAWEISPTLSMQLNVWAEHWSGETNFDGPCIDCDTWFANRMGIGTHLTYNSGGFQFGGFASIGTRSAEGIFLGVDPATFANFGLEAAFNADRFRLYVQAGYTIPIAPSGLRNLWADEGIREFYGRLVGTFYPNPNIALSANAGVEVVLGTAPWLPGYVLIWGAEAQFQLSGTPLYLLASYQGSLNRNADDFQIVAHVVRLGIGLNVGSPDLQTRDRAVGLTDYNCTFGVRSTPACGIFNGTD